MSVWVEITLPLPPFFAWPSRSTWACELKFDKSDSFINDTSHAPRERVSWNLKIEWEQVQTEVTLHVSVWVEIVLTVKPLPFVASRSTWACELKLSAAYSRIGALFVTLHVSVWVEILKMNWHIVNMTSRSTWACELKSLNLFNVKSKSSSRSTWACELKLYEFL